MPRRLLRSLTLALAIVVLAASAGAATTPIYRAPGIVLRYPAGWHVDNRPLTAWTNPAQRFVLSSYRVPDGRPNLDGTYSPPPGGVIADLVEQQAPGPDLHGIPLRPAHFTLPHLSGHLEGFGDHWGEVGFREHGRIFAIFVGVGAHTAARKIAQLLHTLDTMRIARHA